MRKTLKGARTNKDTQASAPDGKRLGGAYLNNNPSKEIYYDDESLSLIIAPTSDVRPVVILRDSIGNDVTPKNILSQVSSNLFEVNDRLKGFKAGLYTLYIDHSGQKDIYTIDIVETQIHASFLRKSYGT